MDCEGFFFGMNGLLGFDWVGEWMGGEGVKRIFRDS